jgi:hypothetical protein
VVFLELWGVEFLDLMGEKLLSSDILDISIRV